MYNISSKEFQDELDLLGSAVRSLPRGTYTADSVKRGYAPGPLETAGEYANVKRQRLTTKTKGGPPPPALAAQRVVSTTVVLTPRGSGAASSPAASSTQRPGASTPVVLTPRRVESATAAPMLTGPSPEARANRAAFCRNWKDGYMYKLNQACKRRQEHLSHTQRFREDAGYRADMISRGVPEWLVFHSSGHTSRFDGQDGDQWPA